MVAFRCWPFNRGRRPPSFAGGDLSVLAEIALLTVRPASTRSYSSFCGSSQRRGPRRDRTTDSRPTPSVRLSGLAHCSQLEVGDFAASHAGQPSFDITPTTSRKFLVGLGTRECIVAGLPAAPRCRRQLHANLFSAPAPGQVWSGALLEFERDWSCSLPCRVRSESTVNSREPRKLLLFDHLYHGALYGVADRPGIDHGNREGRVAR